jgi:solute carrier family 25 phosphate transporter 3
MILTLIIGCRTYADMAGEELFNKYQTLIFLAGSASAEFFADIALSPFEAVKVRTGCFSGTLLVQPALHAQS